MEELWFGFLLDFGVGFFFFVFLESESLVKQLCIVSLPTCFPNLSHSWTNDMWHLQENYPWDL